MIRIVLTNDLHVGLAPERAIRALCDRISAEAPDPVVLAGDIADLPPHAEPRWPTLVERCLA